MRKQFFKRSVQIRSLIVFIAIMLIAMVVVIKTMGYGEEAITAMAMIYVISFIALSVLVFVTPPDFKYWIRAEGEYIIFEINEADHRPILKKYSVINKNYKKMVLEDERGTIISIAYSATVQEFLKQERIE